MSSVPQSFEEARAQAAEYLGILASEKWIASSGAVFEIPNPSMLDDDQQTRIDKLNLDAESWKRHPDKLNDDGSLHTRGALMVPHRTEDGQLVEHYDIQQAKAILGDRYQAFKDAGGRASDITLIWWKMNRKLAERQAADSKSAGSDSPVEAPSDAD